MVQIHIGFPVSQLNPSIRNLSDCAELSLRDPVPSPRTLRRWRSELEQDFLVSLRWVVSGQTRKNQVNVLVADERKEWLKLAKDSAQDVGASVLLIENAADLRPTPTHMKLLKSIFHELKESTPCNVVWSQNGLWEPEHLAEIEGKSKIILCSDPLQNLNALTKGEKNVSFQGERQKLSYAKIKQIGIQQKISDSTIRELVNRLRQPDTNSRFLIIEGANPGPLCKRLRSKLAEPDTLL